MEGRNVCLKCGGEVTYSHQQEGIINEIWQCVNCKKYYESQ